ncbi:HAD family hydrolase [Roseococcus microcysteis]|uniref:HAD family hydrolase n=1 Tax=Roseococcus microcysteis TaxID=2771361 RepID=UPI00168BA969|nr:HAD family hydrolase [Roseococcus microcysteis]
MLPLFRAVLFDCDGVLADSESIANTIVAEEVTALGWALTPHAAEREFLGVSLPDMLPRIAARVPFVPPGWPEAVATRITAELARSVRPMPGAIEAVAALAARGVPMAVCSNSGREELAMKMTVLGLAPFFEGRVFSFQDVPRPKPAPDLYTHAAAACGLPPRNAWWWRTAPRASPPGWPPAALWWGCCQGWACLWWGCTPSIERRPPHLGGMMLDPNDPLWQAEQRAIRGAFLAMLALFAAAAGLTWAAIAYGVPIGGFVGFVLVVAGVIIYGGKRIGIAMARLERARAADQNRRNSRSM